jgi:thymidylate synthase ThyX
MKVIACGLVPPERAAFALARYSRSSDTLAESLAWVKDKDSSTFLEHFYFQYGHASIADLGHVTLSFEGISALAAIFIEDEQLWDGQERSTRFQDFSQCEYIVPAALTEAGKKLYRATADHLLSTYLTVYLAVKASLGRSLPRPPGMEEKAYDRALSARAFDNARYLLFLGIPTNVGQVTSIRTLERQIGRLLASPYAELREIAEDMRCAMREPPQVGYDAKHVREPVAPTLARFVKEIPGDGALYEALRKVFGMKSWQPVCKPDVELTVCTDKVAEMIATELYQAIPGASFGWLYEHITVLKPAQVDLFLQPILEHTRKRGGPLGKAFRGHEYAFDICMDIGGYRDLHRHRRCEQFRQPFTDWGFPIPEAVVEADVGGIYVEAMQRALHTHAELKLIDPDAADYIMPFGAFCRSLFKMDFAEAQYVIKLRSGVKGHFSYRRIVYAMYIALREAQPGLAAFLEATPPWVTDPLTR